MTFKRYYTKLNSLKTFDDRFDYLSLGGKVGVATFGVNRPLNQRFYRSPEWLAVRDAVLVRDNAYDLGVPGYEIVDQALVHHMNPITEQDLIDFNPEVIDPEYLITVSAGTHKAIHYGDTRLIPRLPTERRPGDTRLW